MMAHNPRLDGFDPVLPSGGPNYCPVELEMQLASCHDAIERKHTLWGFNEDGSLWERDARRRMAKICTRVFERIGWREVFLEEGIKR